MDAYARLELWNKPANLCSRTLARIEYIGVYCMKYLQSWSLFFDAVLDLAGVALATVIAIPLFGGECQ